MKKLLAVLTLTTLASCQTPAYADGRWVGPFVGGLIGGIILNEATRRDRYAYDYDPPPYYYERRRECFFEHVYDEDGHYLGDRRICRHRY